MENESQTTEEILVKLREIWLPIHSTLARMNNAKMTCMYSLIKDELLTMILKSDDKISELLQGAEYLPAPKK